jgi:hypothetical protein
MTANWLVLDDFGPSDKVFDWMADRLAEDPTGLVAWRVDHSVSVSTLALCNLSLTFVYVDVSMRRHRVK